MKITPEMERNANTFLRILRETVTAKRVSLVNLLVAHRDDQARNPDLGHLQHVLDELESVSRTLETFRATETGRRWEGA